MTYHMSYTTETMFTKRERIIGAGRLTVLADYLQSVKSSTFKMEDWVSVKVPVDNSLHLCKLLRSGAPGVTACALGHAATLPTFRSKGLGITLVDGGGLVKYSAANHTFINCQAASQFFKLTTDEAAYIFDPQLYPIKKDDGL